MKKTVLLLNPATCKRLVAAAIFGLGLFSGVDLDAQSGYVKGDFHQHTTFTDGSWTMDHVFEHNNFYGLDWWANSEHGGGFSRNGIKSGANLDSTIFWDQDSSIKILGTVSMSGGHQNMWRWQSLRDFSFPQLNSLRSVYKNKLIMRIKG
jgi:hypothetical protein